MYSGTALLACDFFTSPSSSTPFSTVLSCSTRNFSASSAAMQPEPSAWKTLASLHSSNSSSSSSHGRFLAAANTNTYLRS